MKQMKGIDSFTSVELYLHLHFIVLIFIINFSSRVRTKKRLIFPGKPSVKKKKKKKVLSKLDGVSKDENLIQKPTSPQHHDTPDDAEGERIIRKSTRTSVVVRQAEREAIRAALQATMKASFGYCILSSFVGKYNQNTLVVISKMGKQNGSWY